MRFKSAQSGFFDRAAIQRDIDHKTRRVFSRFGAYVRRRSRQSIRKRKKSSEPGKAPSDHTGLLRKLIFFSYDRSRQSVVIGPARFNRAIGNAPEALEHGGETDMVTNGKRRRVRIQARPFMGPAFEQVREQLPQLWRDSVR